MRREPDRRLLATSILGSARPNPRRLIGPPNPCGPTGQRAPTGQGCPSEAALDPPPPRQEKTGSGTRARIGEEGARPTCGQVSCGNAQSRRERGRGGSEQRGEGGLLCSEPGCPGAASSGPGFFLCLEWSSREAARLFTHGGSPGCASSPTPPPLTRRPTDPPTHRSSSRGGSPLSRPHLASAGAERSTGGR